MAVKIGPWSYSSAKLFETCPRKYQAERITKEVPYTDSDATIYGKELHLAAEEFIRDGKPLPVRFGFLLPILEKLNDPSKYPGERFCELKLGLKKEDGQFVSCDFFDESVWFRGVADLVILDKTRAWVIDYKTGKSAKYADMRQLALMAACLFVKYPHIQKIKAGLLFVVSRPSPAFIQAEYTKENGLEIFSSLYPLLTQREAAYTHDVWNEKPNGLCAKWCKVLSCPHQG